MNTTYAIEILETVERGTLDAGWLSKEAFRYLKNRKKTSNETLDRIEKAENKTRTKFKF